MYQTNENVEPAAGFGVFCVFNQAISVSVYCILVSEFNQDARSEPALDSGFIA